MFRDRQKCKLNRLEFARRKFTLSRLNEKSF